MLYHRCPDCRSAKLATAEGFAEVPGEVVDRVEGEAKRVEIPPEEELPGGNPASERDRPKPRWLAKKVQLRDGETCSNPLCSRTLGLHTHHIEFCSWGGRTALWNETLLCSVCHAAVHQGLLEIAGDPATGVRFKPKGTETSVGDFTEELKALATLRKTFVVETSPDEDKLLGGESTCIDKGTYEELVSALRNLGYPGKRARQRIE